MLIFPGFDLFVPWLTSNFMYFHGQYTVKFDVCPTSYLQKRYQEIVELRGKEVDVLDLRAPLAHLVLEIVSCKQNIPLDTLVYVPSL